MGRNWNAHRLFNPRLAVVWFVLALLGAWPVSVVGQIGGGWNTNDSINLANIEQWTSNQQTNSTVYYPLFQQSFTDLISHTDGLENYLLQMQSDQQSGNSKLDQIISSSITSQGYLFSVQGSSNGALTRLTNLENMFDLSGYGDPNVTWENFVATNIEASDAAVQYLPELVTIRDTLNSMDGKLGQDLATLQEIAANTLATSTTATQLLSQLETNTATIAEDTGQSRGYLSAIQLATEATSTELVNANNTLEGISIKLDSLEVTIDGEVEFDDSGIIDAINDLRTENGYNFADVHDRQDTQILVAEESRDYLEELVEFMEESEQTSSDPWDSEPEAEGVDVDVQIDPGTHIAAGTTQGLVSTYNFQMPDGTIQPVTIDWTFDSGGYGPEMDPVMNQMKSYRTTFRNFSTAVVGMGLMLLSWRNLRDVI